MRFDAKLDDLSKILTFVVLGVLVIPTALIVNMALHGEASVLIPLVFALASLGLVALFRITSYELTPDAILVHRPVGTIHIERHTLRSATPVTTKDLGFGLRVLGSGGWLGYFGYFWYRHLGWATLYATDRSKLLLLQTKTGKNLVVSPVDGSAFLEALALPTAPLPQGSTT